MKLKNLFTLHAVIAVGYAIAFFVAPGPLIGYYGITPSEETIFMSRFFGMGLLGLGLVTGLARNAADSQTGGAIVLALVITYSVGFILALLGTLFGSFVQRAGLDRDRSHSAVGVGLWLFQIYQANSRHNGISTK